MEPKAARHERVAKMNFHSVLLVITLYAHCMRFLDKTASGFETISGLGIDFAGNEILSASTRRNP